MSAKEKAPRTGPDYLAGKCEAVTWPFSYALKPKASLCKHSIPHRILQVGVGVNCFLALAACASIPPEPVIITQRVDVPVMVPCIAPGSIPAERQYADQTIRPPASLYQMTQAMGVGIAERDEDLIALRAALAGCVVRE